MISHALDVSFGHVFSKILSIGETEEIPNYRETQQPSPSLAAFPQLSRSGATFPAIHLSNAAGATAKLGTRSENKKSLSLPSVLPFWHLRRTLYEEE